MQGVGIGVAIFCRFLPPKILLWLSSGAVSMNIRNAIFVGNSLSLADFRGITYWWYMLSLVLSLSITGLAAWLARKCAVQLWARWALELGDAADEGHNVHTLIESGAIARPCSACRCCQGVVGPVDCACCDCCY